MVGKQSKEFYRKQEKKCIATSYDPRNSRYEGKHGAKPRINCAGANAISMTNSLQLYGFPVPSCLDQQPPNNVVNTRRKLCLWACSQLGWLWTTLKVWENEAWGYSLAIEYVPSIYNTLGTTHSKSKEGKMEATTKAFGDKYFNTLELIWYL